MPGPPAAYDDNPSTYSSGPDYADSLPAPRSAPSRGSPGAGYHTENNLTPQAYGLMAANPDSRWSQTPQGRQAGPWSMVGSLASVLTGIPGLGMLGYFAGNRYTPEATAWNEGRMRTGQPHHNPQTGVWTSDGFLAGLDPSNWHPGPYRETPTADYADSELPMLAGASGAGGPDQSMSAGADPGMPAVASPAEEFSTPQNEMLARILARRRRLVDTERDLLRAEAPNMASSQWMPTA